MIFCPRCGFDRRQVAPVQRCPKCGGPGVDDFAELADGGSAPSTPAAIATPPPPPPQFANLPAGAPPPPPPPQFANLPAGAPASAQHPPSPSPIPPPPQVVYVAAPPVQPKVGSILFGVLLVGAALWLLLNWIPAHKPWSEDDIRRLATDVLFRAKVERLNEWRLKPNPYLLANGLAILIGLLGVSRIVHGASHRPRQG